MSARVAVIVGVVATLAANVASAEPTATARLVAIAAPVSFLLSVEVLTRTGRIRTEPTKQNAVTATESAQKRPTLNPVRGKPRKVSTGDRVAAAKARTPEATNAQIAAKVGTSERTVQRYLATYQPGPVEATAANGDAVQ
jgi:hypothetical protein